MCPDSKNKLKNLLISQKSQLFLLLDCNLKAEEDQFCSESELVFVTFQEPRNRFQGIDSASQAGRYDIYGCLTGPPGWESIPGLLKRFTNTGSGGPIRQIRLSYRPARLGESIPCLLKRFTNSGSGH